MKVKDLKNILNQMDPDNEVVFNLELMFEDENENADFTINKEQINVNNMQVIRTYEEGICNMDSDYEKSLNINLYAYIPYEDYREE